MNCGKEAATGDRALAIRTDGVKRWHCHEYGCGKGGNLIGLCNYLKEGVPDEGQPRGARFKQILADLKGWPIGSMIRWFENITPQTLSPREKAQLRGAFVVPKKILDSRPRLALTLNGIVSAQVP